MSRRKIRTKADWFQLHALPFLSIMLGLISVMALTSMALTVEQRETRKKKKEIVKLASIPSEFIPVHVICDGGNVIWHDLEGDEHSFSLRPPEPDPDSPPVPYDPEQNIAKLQEFVRLLGEITAANRRLSFRNKQYTLILWVKPSGARTALEIQGLVAGSELPLRIGKLPLLENETVRRGAVSDGK